MSSSVRADAPWLVFLPGLTADHTLFDKQLEHFNGEYNCFVWDAPSHGESRPFPLDWTLADLAKYLHDILNEESVEQPIIVGQSMGGYIAQAYMALYPQSVAGFVSVDSCPLARSYYSAAELWLLKHTKLMYLSIPWKWLLKWGPDGCSTAQYGRNLMKNMMLDYSKSEYCSLTAHGYWALQEAAGKAASTGIDCPLLVMCGTKDQAGSTKRYDREWERCEGAPLVWIEGAGYNSNTDAPDEVNRLIEEFVSGL